MKVFNILLTLFLGISLVAAKRRSTTYIEAINAVESKTRELHTVLTEWNGELVDALPISTVSKELADVVQESVDKIDKAKKLRLAGAIRLRRPTRKMMATLQEALTLISDLHVRFGDVLLTGTVRGMLKDQKEASKGFNEAIVKKVPGLARPIVRRIGRRAAKWFDNALEVYGVKQDSKDKD